MKKMNMRQGRLLFTLFMMFCLLTGCGSEPQLNTIELAVNTVEAYDINTDITIDIKTDPVEYELQSEDCSSSGGELVLKDDELVFTSSEQGIFTIVVKHGDVESNVIKVKVEDKKAIEKAKQEEKEREAKERAEKEAKEKAEKEAREAAERQAREQADREAREQAEREAAQQVHREEPIANMVWIPVSGKKYHNNPSCSNMKNPSQVTIGQAQSSGYEPCKKCY